MTSRRRHEATCRRKVPHATREDAAAALYELLARPRPGDATLVVYPCPVDRAHWHVGHARGRTGRRLAKRAENRRRRELWRQIQAEQRSAAS